MSIDGLSREPAASCALAAPARTHPELVDRALADNFNGACAVTFCGAAGRPVQVDVEGLFLETPAGVGFAPVGGARRARPGGRA